MFTLHFVLLGLCALQKASAENAVPTYSNGTIPHELKLLNLRNDSGIVSTSDKSRTPGTIRHLRKEDYEDSLGNEVSDDYDGEEFQDNRLRLMLQPKKSVTLNETKLRILKINPNVSHNSPIISYRHSFAIPSSGDEKFSRNEVIGNVSKDSKKEGNSNEYEIRTDSPIINGNLEETLLGPYNKTEKTVINNTTFENDRTETATDLQYVKVDSTEIASKGIIPNVTAPTEKFVSSPQTSENAPPPTHSKQINSTTTVEESISTPFNKTGSQNTPKDIMEEKKLEQAGSVEISTASRDSGIVNVEPMSPPPSNLTYKYDPENDNFYEELEPDISIEENNTDYITPNETTVNESNTVLIVLPGSEMKQGTQLPGTSALPGKPYISEAISQNLLHLLVNLTAMTAINERDGKKILKELQEQKVQLQDLKRQSDSIYNYIKKMNSDKPK